MNQPGLEFLMTFSVWKLPSGFPTTIKPKHLPCRQAPLFSPVSSRNPTPIPVHLPTPLHSKGSNASRAWSLPAGGTLPPSSAGSYQLFPHLLQVPTNAIFLASSLALYFKEYTPNTSPSTLLLLVYSKNSLHEASYILFGVFLPCLHQNAKNGRTKISLLNMLSAVHLVANIKKKNDCGF